MGDFQHSTTLERLLDLVRQGRPEARDELIEHALARLRVIARRMFRRRPELRGPDETDDVLQKALVRLHHALEAVHPVSVAAFFGLAARQTRWVLLDILRSSPARRLVTFPGWTDPSAREGVAEPPDPEGDPEALARWTEFHRQVEDLPDELREVFDLLWYHGISQQEAADLLGVSLRTVQRRWMASRLRVQRLLPEGGPGPEGSP